MTNNELCLPPEYRSRPANNDGFDPPPAGMDPVYRWIARRWARRADVRTALDWGCGTGDMLVKHFGHLDTLGADVPSRLQTLQASYPSRRWASCPVDVHADLVLCVDVIEHLDDPVGLLRTFDAGSWRHLVITTPDRAGVARHKCTSAAAKRSQLTGPPRNTRHTREWTRDEFSMLVRREIGGDWSVVTIGRFNNVAYCQKDTPG